MMLFMGEGGLVHELICCWCYEKMLLPIGCERMFLGV